MPLSEASEDDNISPTRPSGVSIPEIEVLERLPGAIDDRDEIVAERINASGAADLISRELRQPAD
jgi:hypothetical protein